MDNYRPNSHKYKESLRNNTGDKKVEKVVTGAVKSKKKNEIQKFANNFISEDISNIKDFIVMDIIVPTVKKSILDIVNMVLFGESGKTNVSTTSKPSYRAYYDKVNNRGSVNVSRARSGYDYDDIILDNRGEAEEVLDRMFELVREYDLVSVADLYDLVGLTGNYTDNKYGWTDLRGARVVPVRDGYLLKFPRVEPLN